MPSSMAIEYKHFPILSTSDIWQLYEHLNIIYHVYF